MILLADSKVPEQTMDAQADLGLRCQHMHEDTFSHGVASYFWHVKVKNSVYLK